MTNSFRGVEINTSDVRINVNRRRRKEMERDWPELKCLEGEGVLLMSTGLISSYLALAISLPCLMSRLSAANQRATGACSHLKTMCPSLRKKRTAFKNSKSSKAGLPTAIA